MAFPSVYEMFVEDLTTVRKQHFWEYFSGSKLQEASAITYETDFSTNTGWTTSNSSLVDISTGNNELQVSTNNSTLAQMYYDLGASVSATKWVIRCRILVNGSANTDEPLFKFELNNTANASSNTNSDALGFYVYTDRSNTWSRIYQTCKDSTTSVQGISASPAYYGNISSGTYYYMTLTRSSATDFKVEIRTGSHTGTLLSTLVQSAIPSGTTGLRYLTASNYFQGLGQTMDISEVEFYNGVTSASGIPIRWTNNNYQDTVTVAMADEVDGGLSITGGNSSLDSGGIDFNDIRQYSHDASVGIFVMKRTQSNTSTLSECGFMNNFTSNAFKNNSSVRNNSGSTYYDLITDDGTTGSGSSSSVAVDTSWHTHKIENGTANNKLTIDGVLEVTKTNNRPTTKMQPFVAGTTGWSTSVAYGMAIRYMECYNT